MVRIFMRNMSAAYLLACVLYFCSSMVPANATYRIKDAIADAMLNNKELKVSEDELAISKLEKSKAFAGFWPVVGFNMEDLSSPVESQDRFNNANTEALSLKQELFAGGKTIARIKVAESTTTAAAASFQNKLSEIFLKVVDAYHGVILARGVYQINIDNEKSFQERLEQITTRFNAGEITRTDVSWAKYNLAQAVTQKEHAKGELQIAEANFVKIIGKAPEQDMVEIDLSEISIPVKLEDFIQQVQSNNLNIVASKNNLEAFRSAIAISVADLMPQVTARVGLENRSNKHYDNSGHRYNRDQKSTSYVLNVSMPLFSSQTYIDIKESKYKARKAQNSFENVIQETSRAIVEAWSRNQVAISQVSSVKESVIAAKDALDGVRQEYEAGTKTSIDLLDFEQRLARALVEQEKVKKERIISTFKMKALMGQLHQLDFAKL